MIRVKAISVFCLLVLTLGFIGLNVLPALGVPGTGTSITVINEAIGAAPETVWSYTITELSAPKNKNPFTASFNLPTGGTYSFGGLRNGWYRVVETSKFGYTTTITISSNKDSAIEVVDGFETDVNIEASEGKTVTFTNNALPAFATAGLVLSPPSGLGYSIPPLQPIPVQASWDVDVNNDGRLDLVLGKPTVILVNLTGPTFLDSDIITISVAFEGMVHSREVAASSLVGDSIVSFYDLDDEIVPNSSGDEEITGIYQVNGGAEVSLTTTPVTVKDTVDLSLYYAGLTRSKGYGSPATLDAMVQNSLDFINATYPVKNVTYAVGPNIEGSRSGSKRDPYAGMLQDAQAVAQQAQLAMGGSAIGVAIAPGDATSGYFAYHGFPGAAGISFGPAVKGVIALEGYYTVPAHEVAHTFGLYYGVPEEYMLPDAPFTASGVSASNGAWRTGYNFMSVAQYETTDLTWVNTITSYEYLFSKTVVIPNDPEIMLVNGVIYEDGTVEFPLDWIHMQEGSPDAITPGDYLLRYVGDEDNVTLGQISFDASFSVQTSVPDENGILIPGDTIETHEAGFSFATTYPPPGTTKIQVVNSSTGEILGEYDIADVKSFGCSASLDGTEGLDDWYVSDVDVTMTSVVDPTADPPISAVAIHYILDGGLDTIYSEPFTISGDGEHTLEYWGVDSLGNVGVHHTQMVKIDKTSPVVTINAPIDGAYYKTDDVPAADFDVIELNPYDTPVEDGYSTAEGIHTYNVMVTDSAGNFGTDSVTYTVDNTAPVVTITAPDNGEIFYSGSFSVLGLASDASSGVQKVEVKVDGGEYANAVGTNSWSFDVSDLVDGSHVIYARATDIAGNSAETSITVTVRAPYVFGGFSSPIPNSQYRIGRTVPVKFQLTDSQGNFVTNAMATIYVAPVANGEVGTWQIGLEKGGTTNVIGYNSKGNQYQFDLDTSSMSQGTWRIRVDLDDGTAYTVDIELK